LSAILERFAFSCSVCVVIATQRRLFHPASSLFQAPSPLGRNADATGKCEPL
jgi:hypothetical protein